MDRKLSSYEHRSVKRVTAVLSALGNTAQPLRLADLSRRIDLDASTTYRILSSLVRDGYVHKDPQTKRYAIGFEILRFGSADNGRALTAERAYRFLVKIAAELAATVVIGSRYGREVFLHKAVAGPYQQRIPFDAVRTRYVDAHATAIGKALLAFAPRDEVTALYDEAPLRRHTPRTIRDLSTLQAELVHVRRAGFATERDELVTGLCGIAVPIYNPIGHVNMAAWIQCPADQYESLSSKPVAARVQATLADFILYATGRAPLCARAGRELLDAEAGRNGARVRHAEAH